MYVMLKLGFVESDMGVNERIPAVPAAKTGMPAELRVTGTNTGAGATRLFA